MEKWASEPNAWVDAHVKNDGLYSALLGGLHFHLVVAWEFIKLSEVHQHFPSNIVVTISMVEPNVELDGGFKGSVTIEGCLLGRGGCIGNTIYLHQDQNLDHQVKPPAGQRQNPVRHWGLLAWHWDISLAVKFPCHCQGHQAQRLAYLRQLPQPLCAAMGYQPEADEDLITILNRLK